MNRFKGNKTETIDSPTQEVKPTPELPPTLPEIIEPLENETPIIQQDIPVPENQLEIKPIPEQTPETTVPEIPGNTKIVQ